ncbi:MAG: porin [Candidatus Pelagibacterales bacterium]
MKKTLITATAVATVMSASAAYADLSLGGTLARQINSGDATTGISNTSTSSTINVDFTETLDNGMGIAANTDLTPTGALYLLTVSSDMGSFFTGSDFASAVDSMDGAQGAGRYSNGGRILSPNWNDGDAASGNGFGISTSVAGASLQATMGEGGNRAISIAGSMNIAGATVTAGNTDFDNAAVLDNGFITVGYSVGGFNLGYNYYDSDATSATQIGASTTVAGLGVGVSSASTDLGAGAADTDAMGIHVNGDLGGAFWVVDYVNTDNGDGTESDDYTITFGTSF